MLAVVGYIAADLVRIPGDMYSFAAVPRAVDAHDALLTSGPMIQLFAYISLFDIMFTAPAIGAMNDGDREAGGTFSILFVLERAHLYRVLHDDCSCRAWAETMHGSRINFL